MTAQQKKRGFVLIVALMLAIATAAVAVGLVQAGGAANVGVAHTNAGEAARAIAEAGVARAEAYALTISRGRPDFDRVLDPGNSSGVLEADCSNLEQVTDTGVVAETGNLYLPRFSDTGSAIVTYEGLRYLMVPYNGGAYLVRFSDDFDDGPLAPGGGLIDWSASTSNTRSGAVGSATWCGEGPAATGAAEPGINGVNNPARDRNRTIWANVVGIYPGTNPATAKHRTMLSKVIMDGRVIGPAGMRIGGNMNISNGAEVRLCSEVSGITTTGNINTGPPNSCACGSVQATTVDINDGQCSTCCGTNTFDPIAGSPPPPPTIPAISANDWYDWSSTCNFYMDPSTMSFFYWDGQASRNGVACSTHNSGPPAPSRAVTDIGSCWVPLWFNTEATPTTAFTFSFPLNIEAAGANDEISASAGCTGGGNCTLQWMPRALAVGPVNIGSDGGAGRAYYTSAGVQVTKPNWDTACPRPGSPSDFQWNPPQLDTGVGEEVTCSSRSNDCDGSRAVISATEVPGGSTTRFQLENNPEAYPAGVYFHAGALHVDRDFAVPGAQAPLASNAWPMLTLIVNGNVTMTNAKELVLGVGTRRRFFPSLVVNGNLSTSNGAQLALAGSLYVIGDIDFDHGNAGGTFLYGRVEVTGNFNQASGSRVDWNYDTDLYAAGVVRRAQEPRLGLPLGF